MADVEVNDLFVKFKDVVAVDNINFHVKDGELVTLLGPSGCGKTTSLRCISGLEKPNAGEIRIGGEMMTSSKQRIFVPPNKRRIGMVFQSYAIWPHMTVFNNVAYGLKLRGFDKDTVRQKVEEMLKMMDLGDLGNRYPNQLSGGQQQRVALARSLIYEPTILLLDEPLSNLDAKLRERARFWLVRLQRDLKITTIYVTHDQAEAMVISDRIIVMNKGKISQTGTAEEIYKYPADQFVADFIGISNFLRGKIVDIDAAGQELKLSLELIGYNSATLICRTMKTAQKGQTCVLSIRPEDVIISKQPSKEKTNTIEGKISRSQYVGTHHEYWVSFAGDELRLQSKLQYESGERVWISCPTEFLSIVAIE